MATRSARCAGAPRCASTARTACRTSSSASVSTLSSTREPGARPPESGCPPRSSSRCCMSASVSGSPVHPRTTCNRVPRSWQNRSSAGVRRQGRCRTTGSPSPGRTAAARSAGSSRSSSGSSARYAAWTAITSGWQRSPVTSASSSSASRASHSRSVPVVCGGCQGEPSRAAATSARLRAPVRLPLLSAAAVSTPSTYCGRLVKRTLPRPEGNSPRRRVAPASADGTMTVSGARGSPPRNSATSSRKLTVAARTGTA